MAVDRRHARTVPPVTTALDPSLAARRLDRWKLSLLDLTLRNRLLDARDGRQVVALAGADPVALATTLDEGRELELVAYAAPTADAVGGADRAAEAVAHVAAEALIARRLLVAAPAPEVERRLVAMSRAARESLTEGGARTLWFGLGVLRWFEADAADVARHAPLVLVPAELKRAGDRYRVVAVADEEPRWNQTLFEKLRVDFGLALAPPDADAELDVAAVMATVAAAVAGRPGWAVLAEARLGIFSFTKFAMWTDLAERGEALLGAPVVQHLAMGAGRAFPEQGAFLDPGELDRTVPLGELFAPLDCDASQLTAVMAGAAGRSFVLQGPPGTGKSQTITNLIAQALATGKTVLFVAEKIAALEVVERRLAAVGLGDFCLELHSHKAKKREVIGELGRVLERVWRPNTPVAGDDERLAEVRIELDDYAAALHAPQPTGGSVHDALARLGELRDAPKLGDAAATAQVTSAAEVATRREAVARLAEAAREVAPPTAHPWRGSTLDEWKLSSEDAVAAAVGEAQAAATALAAQVAALPAQVPGLEPKTRTELEAIGVLADHLATSPRPGAELVIDARDGKPGDDGGAKVALIKARAGATSTPRDVSAWLALVRHRRALADKLDGRWTAAVYEPALTGLADTFRTWADRFALFRWFALRGPRKAARKALASGALPADAAIADDLDAAREARTTDDVLDAARPTVKRWLGALAPAAEADAPLEPVIAAQTWARELRAAFDKVGVAAAAREQAWRAVVGVASDAGGATAAFAELGRAVTRWRAARAALTATCGVDVDDGADGRHLPALIAATTTWATAPGALRAWTAYARARKAALAAGLGPLIDRFEAGAIEPDQLALAWERAMLLGVADAGLAASPALSKFHGASHHARVAELVELDRAQLGVARARAIARLAERVPRIVAGEVADTGEVGLLLHELKKQRRHKPLRALFREIPTLLTRLKPCLLMSPLSVAQYLDPAITRFDLVVFDEASQIPTADAIGALARGEAAVVVGDSHQLPPTRFFAVGDGKAGDGAAAGDEDDDVEELESVLDECVAARLPELRLRWHYRSRHEDLIAFSNDRYYGGTLDVFPAASARVADLGVSLRRVAGVYDRAGTRTNRTEAEAVVAEVKYRLLDAERGKRSLAVVTFSKPQQELILDLLDEARREHPELEPFFADDAAEPVLVKNLETIQGDERDVVLFSIGYGPDRDGGLTMNFGPLGKDGGERRLNVAVTRAREQLVVFSSIDAEQIRADVTAPGVRHLAELLAYARAGGQAGGEAATRPPATRLTAAIGAALTAKGWIVHHQIGCAGYRLDLAVVDPDEPGRYVLAIEADGAAYAAARTARDRDRLRAQVLTSLGWRLHRIWSLDWWHDGEKELLRAHNAVINAIAKARAGRKPPGAGRSGPVVAPAAGVAPMPPMASGASTTAPIPSPAARAQAAVPTSPTAVNDAPTSPTPAPVLDQATVPTPMAAAVATAATPARPAAGGAAGRPGAASSLPAIAPRPSSPALTPPAAARATSRPSAPPPGGPPVQPYVAASVPAGRRTPDDLQDPARAEEVGKVIDQVLAVEAPISLGLLCRRVGAYFGVARFGDKVEIRVREVAAGRAQFGTGDDADVIWRKDQNMATWPAVRVPSQAAETRREAAEVPVVEIASASLVVLARNLGLGQDDLARETAKLLGFARYTDKVAARMRDGLLTLISRGACHIEDGHVSLP